jgi:hypothetical protein
MKSLLCYNRIVYTIHEQIEKSVMNRLIKVSKRQLPQNNLNLICSV